MAKAKKSAQSMALAKQHKAIIFREDASRVEYLTVDLIDDSLLEKSEQLMKKEAYCWPISGAVFESLQKTNRPTGGPHSKILVEKALSDDTKLNNSSPFAILFKQTIKKAKKGLVSDIHIEPAHKGVSIRFRRHGALYTHKTLQEKYSEGLISAVKNIVNMDLGIVGRPQDSRASFKSLKLDVRASSLPGLYGEKIVLRLFHHNNEFSLNKLGLSKPIQKVLKESIGKRDGIILVSGPTGSGKTTTLYSLLGELPRHQLNISTLENPVEYELPGINQINIKENGPMTFNSALRALMRQDPDVIFVGEIRDRETAALAFRAASTGHLVLSTVHASRATVVIERLLSLGVSEFSIKSNLRLSSSQRLLPLLCPHCSQRPSKNDMAMVANYFRPSSLADLRTVFSTGCSHCQAGLVGRTAILEYMDKSATKNFFDNPKKSEASPKNSLLQTAIGLAKDGMVDCREVLAL